MSARRSRAAPNAALSPLSDARWLQLQKLIEREIGVRMQANKRPMLLSRLVRRARVLGLGSIDAYCDYLFDKGASADELSHFIDAVTTNVTSFFREPKQLELLREHLVELAVAASAKGRELRVWSAACSRGHEVWTLAMMLAELEAKPNFCVYGSDISRRVLEEAVRGVYRESELTGVPAELRGRYFMHSRDRSRRLVRVVPELRRRARFVHLNLMAPEFSVPHDFDLALLRNVLIYFEPERQAEISRKVASHLQPRGLLCVGLSESLHRHVLPLEHLQLGIYRLQAKA
jgi:chemotaxis protein methyltransferase CheR